jgi:hypothetical protein
LDGGRVGFREAACGGAVRGVQVGTCRHCCALLVLVLVLLVQEDQTSR